MTGQSRSVGSSGISPAAGPTPTKGVAVAAETNLREREAVILTEWAITVLALDPEEFTTETDLRELGLDSIQLMALAGRLRKAGVAVTFGELAAEPTIGAWQRLIDAAGPAVAERKPVRAETTEPFELGLMQHAFWIGRHEGQPLGGVGAHFYVELEGRAVDPDRLRAATVALRRRHPMLRTVVLGDGRQRVAPDVPADAVTVHDLRAADPARVDARLAQLRERYTHRRMDVERGDVLDIALSMLPGGDTRLHIDLDMVAADALSMRILLTDLRAYYLAPDAELPALEIDYAGYLAARRVNRTAEWERARDWWRARLPELSAPPRLPVVVDPHTAESAHPRYRRSARRHHWLSPRDKERLSERARRHRVSPAAVLATAFAETLAAWSAQHRFLLNVPLFDRDGAERLVGDFSGSVLVDADLRPADPFAAAAARLQDATREAIAHSAFSGVEVLRELTRAGGAPALAPVVYTSAIGLGEIYERELQQTFGAPVWMISQNPQVLLDAQVTELDGGLLLNWDFREHAFAAGVVDAAFDSFRELVDRLVSGDAAWLHPVQSLLPGPQAAVRARVNDTTGPLPAETLHGEFFRCAARQPERTALRWDGGRLSYGALAHRARQVAALLREHGVRPGDTVAITLPKGVEQPIAVLGVLAAGAAYVPVGVDHPELRRAGMRHSAGVRALITVPAYAPAEADCPVLYCGQAEVFEPVEPLDPGPEALAYVVFTSGSTGVPKGVEVSHGAVVNTVTAVGALFEVGAADRTIALSSLDFDLSAYDLFALLRVGGSVVVVEEHERRDARRWAELMHAHRVSVLSCVPALLDMLLSATGSLPDSLRLVMSGGDRIGPDLVDRWRALVPHARFAGLGGMTEAAIHSTVFEVDEVDPTWRSVPYGVPLRNMRARVVDGRGRDCPDRVTGELWVSGPGLAEGYRGDPERTAAKFVRHAGRRWYRTGDLARYTGDGVLEFLGRADHQVQIRGHRIELGEIEATAAAHPAVTAAVATVLTEPTRRPALQASGALTVADLRDWLTARLPPYLVPEQLRVAPIALTANGKLDRAAVTELLATDRVETTVVRQPPSGPTEELVARVFADVLGVAAPDRNDSFFALGGDSLLATRAVARLAATGANIGRLFATPVLRDFAATLVPDAATIAQSPDVTADPAARYEPFAATDVQRAYWIGRDERLPLGGVGTHHYTEFDGPDVDLDRMEQAWRRLIGRHEMLRVIFDDNGDQRILAETPDFRIEVEEVADESAAPAAWARLRAAQSHRVFDLTCWPLFAVRAVRYPAGATVRTRMAVGLDYTILDARSIMTLLDELARLYREPEAQLPPIDMSFRDYVLRAGAGPGAATRRHWSGRLDALPAAPELPRVDDPALPRFTRRERVVAADRWEVIRSRAREYGVTPSAVLLACYGEVLAAWSGQAGVAVTLTLFNRDPAHPHIDRVLGDFTAFSVLGYRAAPGPGWLDGVRDLHRTLGEDLGNPVPAGWLLSELGRRAGAVAAAVPVVFTSALGLGDTELPADFPARIYGLSQSPQVLLDNQVTERGEGIAVTWDAVEARFPGGVLDAMFDAYNLLIDALVDCDWRDLPPDLLPASQRAVRAMVGDTTRVLPDRLLHEPFFRLARQRPDTTALVWDGGALTYGALADKALRVAGAVREHGVAPGGTVAVSLPKGPDQIAAVLGVLAAGAVYVPIGVDQPRLRRERMLRVARAEMVIAEGGREFTAAPLPDPAQRSVDDLAYLIFTSGSTGDPKAVAVTHRGAGNTVADLTERFELDETDRVLAVSALDFDLSVFDIFGLLGVGGALVLPGELDRRAPETWLRLACEHRVTVWNSAPMLLDLLMTAAELDPELPAPRELRLALLSGDWIGLELPGRLRASAPRCRFIALGGATEASIWSNSIEVDTVPPEWTSIPYGRPLANQRYRVVDELGRDCPDWTAGELWIGGAGVAAGYRGGRPAEVARFVEYAGERWYRTGDRGRYWPDGTLEFLGRIDHQVKIGGHRIELGEIEAALEAHPEVARAVAVAEGARGHRRLRAVVAPAVPVDLTGHLAARLPAHAVPSRIDAVAALPLTANGKVDRGAVVATGAEAPVAEPPRGELEQRIAALWARHLDEPPHDRRANFFAAGGNSLTALRFVAAVNEELGIDIAVPAFLRMPTPADLAHAAEQLRRNRETEESGIV